MYSSYKNMEDLLKMNPEPFENEKVWIEDIEQYCQWNGEAWIVVSTEEENDKEPMKAEMTLYDMNKQLVLQAGPLSAEQIEVKRAAIVNLDRISNNNFYMLYGQEINYFTIFMKDYEVQESFGDLVLECLNNIGTIYSIELTEDKFAIEIWVEANPLGITCMYLFPYDSGIVPFGG